MRARTVLLLFLVATGAGLIGVWRLDAAEDARREEGIEASRVRGWARSEGGAGPSVLPLNRVPVADEKQLRELEELPGFHDYAMRCSSCHQLPDPAAYPAKRWIGKVDEMREQIRRAGIMPPPESELEAAREFLRAASDSLHTREEGDLECVGPRLPPHQEFQRAGRLVHHDEADGVVGRERQRVRDDAGVGEPDLEGGPVGILRRAGVFRRIACA